MRALILAGLFLSTSAVATPADNQWHAKARALLDKAIAYPTVAGRNQVPAYAEYLAGEYKAAGFSDVRVVPHEGQKGDGTAALIVRWPAAGKAKAKPILLMSHMDVVEAKPTDWTLDPFKLIEKDGYYYGRGTTDIKSGNVAVTAALLKLKAEGFKPNRDLIVFFTGDEETEMNGARLGATDWRKQGWTDAEFGLNSDGGGGAFTKEGRALGFGLQTAEKTYQSYDLTVRNRGGHSSRPRPDNAIYELATALKKLEAYRFTPALNETTRAYFVERAKQESGPLGDAMRRWIANPNDGAAADTIEANELEVGTTRTRCVATMLSGGHADNALPQLAQARVNCRILPGVEPKAIEAELKQVVGPDVEVTAFGTPNVPTPVSPLRPDVVGAYTRSVRAMFPNAQVIPQMSTGATDGKEFRAVGIPVYGVDGSWIVSPDDERAHGRDERLPVKALDDDVDHWVRMIRSLAG
ncbi:M20/M25/M40 family metallo-hydrolase [Sphingomonas sp. ID1715]|uniref:M20/M25/M40 family metallo-hydrolase n=1 Tax=Sphingomonas sp. ID1715 TaxID=1656898 RepID=UPI001C2CB59E|nr:M20/M25/M40 family metallo-hydrolase [Sphingomonas sp. ID1715]